MAQRTCIMYIRLGLHSVALSWKLSVSVWISLDFLALLFCYLCVRCRDGTGSPGHGSPGQQFGSGSGRVTGQSSDPDFDPGSCSMQ